VDTGSGQGLGSLEQMNQVVGDMTSNFQNLLAEMEDEEDQDFGRVIGGLFNTVTPLLGHVATRIAENQQNQADNPGGCQQQ